MTVEKKGEEVLEGTCTVAASMCHVQISTTPQPIPTSTIQASNTFMADRNKPDLAQWYHAALFSPVKQTLIQAIKKG